MPQTELLADGLTTFGWEAGQPLPGVAGRGSVRVLQTANGPTVVRHYRRGGALAALLNDRYWFRGAQATRCFREFKLLQRLVALGLPVCTPLAARFQRSGLWYRADLATALIPNARSLHQMLVDVGLQSEVAAEVGRLVARVHAAGLWHADLNAHNVLCDAHGQFWLIDLDRGRLRPPAPGWRQSNLRRLFRSLRKLGHLSVASPSSAAFTRALELAYQHQFHELTAAQL